MLLNGTAGPNDGLWGVNAPFGFDASERRAPAALFGFGNAQKAVPIGAGWAVRNHKRKEGVGVSGCAITRRRGNGW
jgi:hypothetical protein